MQSRRVGWRIRDAPLNLSVAMSDGQYSGMKEIGSISAKCWPNWWTDIGGDCMSTC